MVYGPGRGKLVGEARDVRGSLFLGKHFLMMKLACRHRDSAWGPQSREHTYSVRIPSASRNAFFPLSVVRQANVYTYMFDTDTEV